MRECVRVIAKDNDSEDRSSVTVEDCASLLAACSPASSSPAMATVFCETIARLRAHSTAVAAGVIPALVAAMSTHGAVSADVALAGCSALARLAYEDTDVGDAIVLSSGGVDVLLFVMASHTENGDVQDGACWLLHLLAAYASPAAMVAMRASSAVDALNAVRRNCARDADVMWRTDCTLRELLGSHAAGTKELAVEEE